MQLVTSKNLTRVKTEIYLQYFEECCLYMILFFFNLFSFYLLYILSFILDLITCLFNFYSLVSFIYVLD